MTPAEVNRFNKIYQHHLRLLKLQGKSQKTIDAYSRAVRRVSEHFIHSLRHSFATHLLERGVSLRHIQALLGHASPTLHVIPI